MQNMCAEYKFYLGKIMKREKRLRSKFKQSARESSLFSRFCRSGGMFRGDSPSTFLSDYDSHELIIQTGKYYKIQQIGELCYFSRDKQTPQMFVRSEVVTENFGHVFQIGEPEKSFEVRVVHAPMKSYMSIQERVQQFFIQKCTKRTNFCFHFCPLLLLSGAKYPFLRNFLILWVSDDFNIVSYLIEFTIF